MAKAKSKIPKFSKIRGAIEQSVIQTAHNQVKAIAETTAEDLKRRIENQRFRSFKENPLSDEYAKKKARLGLDPRTMIATGHYKDAIKVTKVGKTVYYVGFDANDVVMKFDENSGELVATDIPLTKLARWHEFGTQNMPRRPHWGPTFRRVKDVMRQLRKETGRVGIRELNRRLKMNKRKLK